MIEQMIEQIFSHTERHQGDNYQLTLIYKHTF